MPIGSTKIVGQLVGCEIHEPKPDKKTGEIKPKQLLITVLSMFNDYGKTIPKAFTVVSDPVDFPKFKDKVGQHVEVPVAINLPDYINVVGSIELVK